MAAIVTMHSRIPAVIAELTPKTLEGVEEVANAVAEGAKERVPVGPTEPHLRDAIHVEVDEEASSVAVVAGGEPGEGIYYGHIVELGSVKMPARPFLVPAYEAERGNLEDVLGEHLDDL